MEMFLEDVKEFLLTKWKCNILLDVRLYIIDKPMYLLKNGELQEKNKDSEYISYGLHVGALKMILENTSITIDELKSFEQHLSNIIGFYSTDNYNEEESFNGGGYSLICNNE